MQGLDIFNSIVFVRLWWFAIVYLTDGFVAVFLQVRPVGKITNNPSKRVAKIDPSSNCREMSDTVINDSRGKRRSEGVSGEE